MSFKHMSKEEYEQLAKDIKDARDAEPQVILIPPDNVDTYKKVLQATQDVFGEENMTVDVMIEAIKVGGSIALLQEGG